MRSIMNTTTSTILNKVLVSWYDIQSCEGAWSTHKEVQDLKLAECHTIGYLFTDHNDKSLIKIFSTYSIDANGTMDYGDVTCIPKACVINIENLNN